jgi:hypothetical protein
MILAPLKEPEWSSESALALRKFIEGGHGDAFLERLAWLAPTHGKNPDATARLLSSGVLEGYELAIQTVLSLVAPRPREEQPTDLLPDLDGPAELWEKEDAETKARLTD